jgi:hypothetical protein
MTQSRLLRAVFVSTIVALSGCGKKQEQAPASSSSTTPAPEASTSANSPAAADDEAQQERKKKMALLDYATMEDQFINDGRGQWASAGKASSTFGQSTGSVSDANKAGNIVGKPDGSTWTNDNQDMGMDWLEADFSKPVHAHALRVVFHSDAGVEAVSKLELQDEQGDWHTAWSGLSDAKRDDRGPRTWFVREFEKTPYKVKSAKITIANNVQSGYKVIDAIQLVGEES